MLLALMASAVIYGTEFPKSFRQGDIAKYTRCLRHEVNEANGPLPEMASNAPTVSKFSQLVNYCIVERSRADSSLRALIEQRNPDWSPEEVANSAEFVLSGMDLELMVFGRSNRARQTSTHDYPPQEF